MSNYDVSLDLDSRNSLSLIISRISKNSTILEFGPANGRMTKYLKETLDCTVYAVELDKDAAKDASEFCEDILVGDIGKFDWLKKYQNIEFDYIIFADVLEHLYDPQTVLTKAKRLLKIDGSVLMSLPNIAHNAIIMDLLDDKFTYRKTGLLDNTHIRFFTKNTLEELITKCGLEIAFETASYEDPSNTEFKNNYADLDGPIANLLSSRVFGEAYQFIFEAKHKAHLLETDFFQEDLASLYIDTGKGFNELEKVTTIYNSQSDKVISFKLEKDFHNVTAVRIDPLEMDLSLKVKILTVNGIDETNNINHNAVIIGSNELKFLNNDPQLSINLDAPITLRSVVLEYEFLTKSYTTKDEKIDLQTQRISSQEQQLEAKDAQLQSQGQQLEAKDAQLQSQGQQLEAKDAQLQSQGQQLEAKDAQLQSQEQQVAKREEECALSVRLNIEHINNLEQHASNLMLVIEAMRLRNRLKRLAPLALKVVLKKMHFKIKKGNEIRRKVFKYIHINGVLFSLKQLYYYRMYKYEAVKFKNTIAKSNNIEKNHADISIIIPTYNGLHDLSKLIPQLVQQKGFNNIEIIIIDSSSNDGTKSFFDNFKEIIFVSIEQKDFSHSYARNLGFTHATSETVLFMVQDAMPTSSAWLYEFVDIFNKNNVVALSCAQIPNAEADLYTCYGLEQFNNFLDISKPITKISNKYISSPRYARKLAQLDNVSCLVKSEVFEKYIFRGKYAEDLDFGLRLIKDKFRIGMTSEVSVVHSHLRSPYYYMKRAMVETEVVNKMFDQPIERINLDEQLSDILTASFAISFLFFEIKKIKFPIDFREFRHVVSDMVDNVLAREYSKDEYLLVYDILYGYDNEIMSFIDVLFKKNIELKKGDLFYSIHHVNNEAMNFIEDKYTVIDKKIMSEYILFILNTYGAWSGIRFGTFKKEYLEKFSFLNELFKELERGV